MADRIDDLRGWWDRTRRRKLKPGVQTLVERVASRETPTPGLSAQEPAVAAADVAPAAPTQTRVDADGTADALLAAAAMPDREASTPGDAADAAPLDAEQESDDTAEAPEPATAWSPTAATEQPAEPKPEDAAPVAVEHERPAAESTAAASIESAVPALALTWAAPGTAPWETDTAEVEPTLEVDATLDPASQPEPEPVPETEDALPEATSAPVAGAADPWAGIARSGADEPAPWSTATSTPMVEPAPEPPAAPDDDPLGLDDDQRRWLGRNVEAVEGIGSGYGAQLEAIDITTLQALLLRGATRRGRQEIADRTGISGKLILRWVNNADLFRIRGVGSQYADLLEAAGVDTVVELALRRPENLVARLLTTNEIRSLVRQVPSEAQVADWIAQAKELPRIVAY